MKYFSGIGLFFILMICGCVKKDNCADFNHPTDEYIIEPNDNIVTVISLKPGEEGKDAVITSYYPDRNYGDRPTLNGEAWTTNGGKDEFTERNYIDFDLSSVPSGAKIQSATLKLLTDTVSHIDEKKYTGAVKGHSMYGGNEWELIKVISPWDESSVTWNNAPDVDTSSKINLKSNDTYDQAYDVDVTDFIKNQHLHRGSSFGFLLKLKTEEPYRLINFCSSDSKRPELHPELIVKYVK